MSQYKDLAYHGEHWDTMSPERRKVFSKGNEAEYEASVAAYHEKLEYLNTYYEHLEPKEFYREIFPVGSFRQNADSTDKKPNGIIQVQRTDGKQASIQVFDDLNEIDEMNNTVFSIMNGVSYYGHKGVMAHAATMYALIFDIDDVKLQNLKDIFHQMEIGYIPQCTLITLGGGGVHLYYVFETPFALSEPMFRVLKKIKFALTDVVWNSFTSSDPNIQHQSAFQKFRIPNSITKFQSGIKYEGFSVSTHRTTLTELLSFIGQLPDKVKVIDVSVLEPILQREEKNPKPLKLMVSPEKTKLTFNEKTEKLHRRVVKDDVTDLKYLTKLSLKEAKEKFPTWHNDVIVEKKVKKGRWVNKRALYDWWKRKMISEIKVGCRYNALLTLVSYANKCNSSDPDVAPVITYEELHKDAMFFLDWYERMTDASDNHFTMEDVDAALSIYGDKFVRMTRDHIKEITKVEMPVNKRNYRKQADHLAKARNRCNEDYPNNTWALNNGHQSKKEEIHAYIKANPGKNPTEYARELGGISRTTIYKYLKSME